MSFAEQIVFFQGLMLILSIGVLAAMIRQRINDVTKYFVYASFLAVSENAGYLLELLANNHHELVYALRVEYMGAAFISTFMFFFVTTYCRWKVPLFLKIIVYINDFLVLEGCWLANYVTFYYKKIYFSTEGGLPHAEVIGGPLYYAFAIQNGILFIGIIVILFRAINSTKYELIRQNYVKILLPIFIPFASYVLYLTGVLGFFDPTPAGVAVGCACCCYVFTSDKSFSTSRMAHTAVYQSIQEPVIIADMNQRFMEANQLANELFAEIGTLKVGEELPEVFAELLDERNPITEIERDSKIYNATVSEISEKEQIFGYLLVLSDVTREREQIQRMLELKEEAEDANMAKSAFLAQMSHEIRTPINSILGMNEMIMRESSEKQIREYSVHTKTAAQALLRIINDILDVSKIESGKMELIPVEYETASLLFDIICMMQQRAQEHGLEFRTDIDQMLPLKLYGDDLRIRQIIINLLSNAIKYTEKGYVDFSIRCVFQDSDVLLEVEVRDTGIGMTEEDLPKIFSAFQRVNENKVRSIQGTGLGIHIVQKLLTLMNSELQVESEFGKGSTFRFTVRQRVVDNTPLGNYDSYMIQNTYGSGYATSFIAPNAKVLVVDDNDMNRTVFRSLLKETEMKIFDAASGFECLELVQEEHYDLIFLDHMMPEMDGVETFQKMQALKNNRCTSTPVIMLTANALAGAKEEYLAIGFNDFLSKPIDTDKLERMIQKYLPQNLVQVQEIRVKENKQEREIIELPTLDEFDFKYAMEILKTKELLDSTMKDFFRTMDQVSDELSALEREIEKPENMTQYRITVHALKSSAAMIGALLLSKLARLLEVAASESDAEKIHRLHPVLVEEIAKHKERLATIIPEEEKKELPPIEELAPMFAMLKNAIANNDYDTSDFLTEQVCSYAYPDTIQEQVDQLRDQVMNLDEEEAIASCEEIALLLMQL